MSDPAWSEKELPENSGSLSLISISGGRLSHSPGLSHSIMTLMPFSGLEHREEYVNFNRQGNLPGCWILKRGC